MSNSSAPQPATRSIPITDRRKWQAFWVCVSVSGLTILDITKVNVALPSIEAAFGAGSTELQLVVSGYILAFGLVLVPLGRLGDQRSRRTLLVIGLALFIVASAACALAGNVWVLLAGRLLQGVAAGTLMPQVMGTIQQLFPGEERGKAFGLFGAMIGLSTAFGPTIGGLLIAVGGETDGWRWIFWMNVPLFAVAIGLVLWLLPDLSRPTGERLSLDPVGVLLFAGAIVGLMTPFLFTTGSADDPPERWWTLLAFVLFGAAFVLWERRYERRGAAPLVTLRLFRVPSFRNGTLLVAAYFAAFPALFLLTTLFLQTGLGISALHAGMVSIGFALASAVSSWYGGRLVGRFGRPVVVLGLVLVLVTVIALAATAVLVPAEATPWAMAGVMVVGGLGGGMVISPNQTLTLADVPPSQGGVAGAIGQLGQRIGTAIGTAVGLSLFYATIFREEGEKPALEVYHDAYATGLIAVALFGAAALALALLDLGGRRRAPRRDAAKAARTR
ncbi:MFS transporter [Microbacterium betulae]|uniref:MFS transporter n=1 Tax=Microbacterium betulae TaxID=2981139 RepID=A0AA97FG00_9MICO|nr:MFS transporter [Microbacterium sp. AB]WOF21739.1 MFS transporter [Microbacterium sp. AB]